MMFLFANARKFHEKDVILCVECASNAQERKTNKTSIHYEKFHQVHNGNRGGYIPDHDAVHHHQHHLAGRNDGNGGHERPHQGKEHPAYKFGRRIDRTQCF